MSYIEAFGYGHKVPEYDYSQSDIWELEREATINASAILENITLWHEYEPSNVVYLNGQRYLLDEDLKVLIPFVVMEELD